MATPRPHPLTAWRESQEPTVPLAELGERVGDKSGHQLAKFERGDRLLPIPLAARVSEETGVPLESLLSKQQMSVARRLFAVLARDAVTAATA